MANEPVETAQIYCLFVPGDSQTAAKAVDQLYGLALYIHNRTLSSRHGYAGRLSIITCALSGPH